MGVIVRTKSDGKKFMEGYPPVRNILQQAQWLEFIDKIDRYDKEVKKSFSQAFDGVDVEIGDMKIVLKKSFIEEVTELHRVG